MSSSAGYIAADATCHAAISHIELFFAIANHFSLIFIIIITLPTRLLLHIIAIIDVFIFIAIIADATYGATFFRLAIAVHYCWRCSSSLLLLFHYAAITHYWCHAASIHFHAAVFRQRSEPPFRWSADITRRYATRRHADIAVHERYVFMPLSLFDCHCYITTLRRCRIFIITFADIIAEPLKARAASWRVTFSQEAIQHAEAAYATWLSVVAVASYAFRPLIRRSLFSSLRHIFFAMLLFMLSLCCATASITPLFAATYAACHAYAAAFIH